MIELIHHQLPVHLRIAGVLLLALAALNLALPKRLRWREELARLSLLNRQIFYVHCAFIVVILLFFSGLLLGCTHALLEPGDALARAVLGGLTIFWFLRLLTQWFVYDPQLWRGNRFNTAIHLIFSSLWLYFTVTFGVAFWANLRG